MTVNVNTPASRVLYLDGNSVHTFTLAAVSGLNFTQDIMIGNDPPNQLGLNGRMDEVEIFNRPLDELEIQAIFQSGSAGKCKGTDLVMNKSHPGDFQFGQPGTYNINVTNNGPGNATGVTVVDLTSFPPGTSFGPPIFGAGWTCTYGPLTCTLAGTWPPGSLPPLSLTVFVGDIGDFDPTQPPVLDNCATVSHSGLDPISANDTDCDQSPVT